ncbi:MAG: hypothetical protein HY335_11410, partial [Deinococcus sp.]|nr:hypothetical protein [Deinococcus sp.]
AEAYGGVAVDLADFVDYHFYADLHYFRPLLDHFRRDWQRKRPWIFGEFCDFDTYVNRAELNVAYKGDPWWLVAENPYLKGWSIRNGPGQQQAVAQLGLPITEPELVRRSYQQGLTMRKFVLESVRSRTSMGGYVITTLQDTPVSTAGLLDDLGRPKWTGEQFLPFNADHVLLLEAERRRSWIAGGDRPALLDHFNHFSGTAVRLHLALSSTDASAFSGALVSWMLRHNGSAVAQGQFNAPVLPAGSLRPLELGGIVWIVPEVQEPTAYQLEVRCRSVQNHWDLWVYPKVVPQAAGWHDPMGVLWPLRTVAGAQWKAGPVAGQVLITTVLDELVQRFVQDGGRALLLQHGPAPLPARAVPFWREGLRLIADHALWQGFPHSGVADLQFYSLATEWALDGAAATLGGTWRPVLRRLDMRSYGVLDYLAEVRLGDGVLLASSLNWLGGAGDQPRFSHSPAAQWLFNRCLEWLQEL